MGIALKEKRLKRLIKKEIKDLLKENLKDKIKDVQIAGEERANPKLPSISIIFEDSSVSEGRSIKTLFKVGVGLCCFLKDVNFERGKETAEEIVGQAADLIIDNLPGLNKDILKVEIQESGEEAEIELKNETILASAILLNIYYFV